PRRIGEHLQHVIFRPRVIVPRLEDAALVPDLLPAGLGLAGVVAVGFRRFGGHLPAVLEGAWKMGKGLATQTYRSSSEGVVVSDVGTFSHEHHVPHCPRRRSPERADPK